VLRTKATPKFAGVFMPFCECPEKLLLPKSFEAHCTSQNVAKSAHKQGVKSTLSIICQSDIKFWNFFGQGLLLILWKRHNTRNSLNIANMLIAEYCIVVAW